MLSSGFIFIAKFYVTSAILHQPSRTRVTENVRDVRVATLSENRTAQLWTVAERTVKVPWYWRHGGASIEPLKFELEGRRTSPRPMGGQKFCLRCDKGLKNPSGHRLCLQHQKQCEKDTSSFVSCLVDFKEVFLESFPPDRKIERTTRSLVIRKISQFIPDVSELVRLDCIRNLTDGCEDDSS